LPSEADGVEFKFFTVDEQAFIDAGIKRLIPPDPVGPAVAEPNVPYVVDRQLVGAFWRGDHYSLGEPWKRGRPEQGYQLRYSPTQLYRAAIPAIESCTARLSLGCLAGRANQGHTRCVHRLKATAMNFG
jgi:gluconate 2-dehydrogenase gamma chain